MMYLKVSAGLLVLVGATGAALGQTGTGGTATNQNASFTLQDYLGDGAGNGPGSEFRVGGPNNVSHLGEAWWWFRVSGDTRETALNGAANADWSAPGVGRVNYVFSNFTATIEYQVTGNGDGRGVLTETMTIRNMSTDVLNINLFNYNDINLGGTNSDDSAVANGANVIRVFDPAGSPWIANYEGTQQFAVGSATGLGLRGRLTDGTADDFSGSGLPFGPGDFSGIFQWTMSLSSGSAATASSTITIVPAPHSIGLLGAGWLLTIARCRR